MEHHQSPGSLSTGLSAQSSLVKILGAVNGEIMSMRRYFDQCFQTDWILHHPLVSKCFPWAARTATAGACTPNPWREVMGSDPSTFWCCLPCCHPQILGHCQQLELHWRATLTMLLWSTQIFGALVKDLWVPRVEVEWKVDHLLCKTPVRAKSPEVICFISCIPPCHRKNHTSFFCRFSLVLIGVVVCNTPLQWNEWVYL